LRRAEKRFEAAGARVVLAGLGSVEEAAAFKKKLKLPFPLIADPEKKLYTAFDLKRMSPLGLLSPALALRAVSALAAGHGVGRPSGDVLQLPGVFIITTAGRIGFSRYAAHPADHPPPGALLAALKNL
jgi:peroxiredoxin